MLYKLCWLLFVYHRLKVIVEMFCYCLTLHNARVWSSHGSLCLTNKFQQGLVGFCQDAESLAKSLKDASFTSCPFQHRARQSNAEACRPRARWLTDKTQNREGRLHFFLEANQAARADLGLWEELQGLFCPFDIPSLSYPFGPLACILCL